MFLSPVILFYIGGLLTRPFFHFLGNLWQVSVFTEVKGEVEISVSVVNHKCKPMPVWKLQVHMGHWPLLWPYSIH